MFLMGFCDLFAQLSRLSFVDDCFERQGQKDGRAS